MQIPFDEASLGAPFLTPEAEKFLLDDEVGGGRDLRKRSDDRSL